MTLTAVRSAANNYIDSLYAAETNLAGDLAMLAARQFSVARPAADDPSIDAVLADMNSALFMVIDHQYAAGPCEDCEKGCDEIVGDAWILVNRGMGETAAPPADPPTSQVFEVSGTFTWPVGVTVANVDCVGAGAGSGIHIKGEGGGGGGALSSATVTKTAATATVLVGAGGGPGVNGGDTSFAQTSTNVLAKGGSTGFGPTGGAGGNATLCIGNATNGGGGGDTGGGSDILRSGGGGGSSGGTGVNGNAGARSTDTAGGAGGAAPAGGYAGGNGGGPGSPGASPSIAGGAGGGGQGANGGIGGRGQCGVSWTNPESDLPALRRGEFDILINEHYNCKRPQVGDALMLAARQFVEV
jgi:hypothetical protein